MRSPWQDAVRPALVRDLLRPTLLARDAEAGLIGEVFARGAWPELRLPLLAAWAQQWDQDDDGAPESLPIVHPRAPEPAPAHATAPVQVQATIIRHVPKATPAAAPPRVRARPQAPADATPPRLAQHPAPAPAPSHIVTRVAAPPVDPRHAEPPPRDLPRPEPHHPEPRPRTTAAELPRVVAAFRPDLAARLEAPRPPADPRDAPPDRPSHVREDTPEALAATRPSHVRADMPEAPAPLRVPARPPADRPAPLIHPPPTDASADAPPPADRPGPASSHVSTDMSPRTASAPLAQAAAADPPRVHPREHAAPADPPRVHPAAPAPAAGAPNNLPEQPSSPPAPARPRVVATAPGADPPRVRPLSRGTAHPRAEARWTDERDAPSRPSAPARAPRRDALPHPGATPPPVASERRVAPQAAAPGQHVPSTIQAPPAPAPPAPAPQLDIDALVETVQRRLARGLERSRELRRALR